MKEKEITVHTVNTRCDKCGQPTNAMNDAVQLECLAQNKPLGWLVNRSRHLLPVIGEDGQIICAGSPSRAQYIEGQPRDARFPYDPTLEIGYRTAYTKLLEAFNYSSDTRGGNT